MLHDKMMKMFGKKRDLSDVEKNAKMDVVKDMRDHAAKAMHGKLDGLKKVSVMSNSSEGLKAGLDKAKGILGGHEEQDLLNDAEGPYSDAEHAHDEHMGEHGPNMAGQEQDSDEQEAFADGGEVGKLSDMEEGLEPSPDEGEEEAVDSESPAEHEEEMEESPEEEMSEQEIDAKLEKLMRAKERLSRG